MRNGRIMVAQPRILGICGAPGTGKTTMASWLHGKLAAAGLNCELLEEPARILAMQGVRIDAAMSTADYNAFLKAYQQRDLGAQAALAIADRTPVDHCSYLEVNRNMPPRFVDRHRRDAQAALAHYRLVFYLPVQFPLRDDGFRVTSVKYQRELDRAIQALLAKAPVRVVEVRGSKNQRKRTLLEEVQQAWPELFSAAAAAG